MSDIQLRLTEHGIDFALDQGDLAVDNGLETAVLISLFSDRESDDSNAIDTHSGWWGDLTLDHHNDHIGSELWTLSRETLTPRTVIRAKAIVEDALQWLIDDAVADKVTVIVAISPQKQLDIRIVVERQGANALHLRFDANWQAQAKQPTYYAELLK